MTATVGFGAKPDTAAKYILLFIACEIFYIVDIRCCHYPYLVHGSNWSGTRSK